MKRELFSGTFFLIISILVTLAAVASLMDGTLNVFAILYAVACWLAYGSAKNGSAELGGIKLGYGVTKALFIVNWVVVGLVAAMGLLVMFAYRLIGDALVNGMFSYGYGNGYGIGGNYGELGDLYGIFQHLGNMGFVWCGLAMLVFAAAAAVINLLFVRNLMTFVKSLGEDDSDGTWYAEKSEIVYKWLFVLGIVTALGVLYMTQDGLASTVSAATGGTMIVASRWIKLRFPSGEPVGEYSQQSEWYSPEP